MTPRKEYDPAWPFPQYDEHGKQLLPVGWNRKPTQAEQYKDLEREVGEALL